MTTEEAQKVLNELNEIKVEELSGNSKRLFEAIMKIADERDLYKSMLEEKDKIIDLMVETISFIDTDIKVIKKQIKEKYCDFLKSDADCCWKTDVECRDCIKHYFENKAKEYLKER